MSKKKNVISIQRVHGGNGVIDRHSATGAGKTYNVQIKRRDREQKKESPSDERERGDGNGGKGEREREGSSGGQEECVGEVTASLLLLLLLTPLVVLPLLVPLLLLVVDGAGLGQKSDVAWNRLC